MNFTCDGCGEDIKVDEIVVPAEKVLHIYSDGPATYRTEKYVHFDCLVKRRKNNGGKNDQSDNSRKNSGSKSDNT